MLHIAHPTLTPIYTSVQHYDFSAIEKLRGFMVGGRELDL